MKIKDIFAKNIDREIRGVIKIGQDEEFYKKQELEEYVVTDELREDFDKFFQAYTASLNHPTDEMGVWISGFFGSGKSHFLKILSYLLDNKNVDGKRPVDYFKDDNKFNDQRILDMITEAEKVPTDVVLFNIDAKADSNNISDGAAILMVFLRVFNEKLGYATDPAVANLERYLDDRGYYEAFKDAFRSETHADWVSTRNNFGFIRNSVKKALAECQAMSIEDASDFVDHINDFQITPEDFAKLVQKYLDKKGNNRHIVFMADEVGQFIGDKADRMLNLQTIVEELGAKCQGRAWVVVTSQQQLNEVTSDFNNKKRQDFSKIQGRFNTMINMTSANADEVIQKRLLAKNEIAKSQLTDIYDEDQYSINNKINFSDQFNRKKYTDNQSFINNYPFIPYQFDLLTDVLVAVRKHGAEGKHMSDGERSMLATFQAAACKYKEKEVSALIPFSAFFSGMYGFLSHDHQVVFTKAERNEQVCPKGNKESLPMQVLQVLFMIKYLDNFAATLENITTLMLSNIYEDRQALTKKIEDALEILVDQKYVQKNIDTYEFLTDKEQDINENINSIDISDEQLIGTLGNFLDDLLVTQYTPRDMNNKYVFKFNMYIDDTVYGRGNNGQNLKIYTPLMKLGNEQYRLEAMTNVVLVLPDDDRYLQAFRRSLQIKQYLQRSAGNIADLKERSINDSKGAERIELEEKGRQALENDLKDAKVYSFDNVVNDRSDVNKRLTDAYEEVIASKYRHLHDLITIKNDKDIVQLLKNHSDQSRAVLDQEEIDNGKAVQEVLEFLKRRTNQGMSSLSMAQVLEWFSNAPYGYNKEDTAWLVAKGFVDGKIRLFFQGEPIRLSEARENANKITGYLLNQSSTKKLTLKVVHELSSKQRKDAKEYLYDVLNKKSAYTETSPEQLASNIKVATQEFINNNLMTFINKQTSLKGPGLDLLDEFKQELNLIANADDSERIFGLISQKLDDLLDLVDELEDRGIQEFYTSSEQQTIWKHAKDYLNKYNDAKNFISEDNGIQTTVQEIENKLDNPNVGKVMVSLKALNERFIDEYSELIDVSFNDYQQFSQERKEVLDQRLVDAGFPQTDFEKIKQDIDQTFAFHDQKAKAESESNQGNLSQLSSEKMVLERSADQIQQKIDQTSARLIQEAEAKKKALSEASDVTETELKTQPKVKKTQTIAISTLENKSWRITNQAELNAYLNDLKDKLQGKLKDYDIVNVDFK